MFVRDLMSTDVVTVARSATLREPVGNILAEGVGSVVVGNEEGNPVGFIMESDILRAAHETERALADIPVSALAPGR